MESLLLFAICGAAIMLYCLPAIIASNRNHPQKTAIFVLNLLIGISGIGWLVALVWAFIVPQPQQVMVIHAQQPMALRPPLPR